MGRARTVLARAVPCRRGRLCLGRGVRLMSRGQAVAECMHAKEAGHHAVAGLWARTSRPLGGLAGFASGDAADVLFGVQPVNELFDFGRPYPLFAGLAEQFCQSLTVALKGFGGASV